MNTIAALHCIIDTPVNLDLLYITQPIHTQECKAEAGDLYEGFQIELILV